MKTLCRRLLSCAINEQLAHLFGSILDAATAAIAAFDRLHVLLADVQRAPECEYWGGDDTSSVT